MATQPMGRIDEAIAAWRAAVGAEHVVTSAAAVELAATATFGTSARVPAIVRPANRAQVQECVRIANRTRTPLYPVSTGKNWSYGSRVPITDCVLLDLGRMKQISDYNERHAYVRIEPGVTMRELYEYLEARGGKLIMSPTGSGADSGLVGNACERGLGVGPDADRFGHVCGMEIVLPTGECIHTGYERFEKPLLGPLSRWAVGPHVDGMFTQSNLGIVTKLTLWLTPRPRFFQAFVGGIADPARLPEFIDAFRGPHLDQTLRSPTLIFNGHKGLALLRQFPWTDSNGGSPLSDAQVAKLLARTPFSTWNFGGGLYAATKEQGLADRARLKQALKGKVDRVMFIDATIARAVKIVQAPVRLATGVDLEHMVRTLYSHSRFMGVPSDDNMRQPYWRKRKDMPGRPDPDADRCGFLNICPTTPFDGQDVGRVVKIAREQMLAHGFEPAISFVTASPRHIEYVIMIIYDRDLPGADDRARTCHDVAMKQMMDEGYLPYRLGVQSMQQLPPATDDYGHFIRTLKRALDPNDILAPGRYDFRAEWRD